MQITFRVRNSFFDRPAVIAALSKARRKALMKAGAFVRRRARSSMRRRAKPSAPGSPPSAHTSDGHSLKTILFAYDPTENGVIVGPVLLNMVSETITGVRTTVPGLHERGETALILEKRFIPDRGKPTAWRRVDRRRKDRPTNWGRREYRQRVARYPKRPFMAPALKAEADQFEDLFANSIR